MNNEFKNLLLETLRVIKDHPDAQAGGIGFVTEFDEEPEWEVIISFAPKGSALSESIPANENLH